MSPMQELRNRLTRPEEAGVLPKREALHLKPRCVHGRPTGCWRCQRTALCFVPRDSAQSLP